MSEEEQSSPAEEHLLEIVFGTFLPLSPEAFATRLKSLDEARGTLLTEDEYQEWRTSVLNELTATQKSQGNLLQVLGVVVLGSGAVAGFGLATANNDFVLGGLFAAVACLFTIAVLALDWRRKIRLGREHRLFIIEFLESEGAITAEEAHQARGTIEAQYIRGTAA